MTSLQSDVLVFNSRQKSSGTNQNANYNLINMGGIGKSPSSTYEMLSYHSVNQVYTVEAGVNDKVYFDEGAGLLTATLSPGSYTETSLLVELIAKMDALSGNSYATSSFSSVTGKYTFTLGAGTFQFLFTSNTSDSARRLLGMNEFDDVLAASHVSDNVVDLKLHSNIFITIPQEGSKNVTLLDGSEFTLMIPLNTAFGQDIHHRKQEHYQQLMIFTSNISNIDIELYTQDGVPLKNTPDYTLILRKLF